MSNGKAGPCIRSGGLAGQGRYGGAVAGLWKAVVGQHAQASLLACAQSIADAWTETAATGRVPREDKDAEIAFLLIQAKALEMQKNWRTIALFSHFGKAWSKAYVRTSVPAVAKVAGPCQCGPLPDRSTRDAVAILDNVFERFTSPGHQAGRRSCLACRFLVRFGRSLRHHSERSLVDSSRCCCKFDRSAGSIGSRSRWHVLHHWQQSRTTDDQGPCHDGNATRKC